MRKKSIIFISENNYETYLKKLECYGYGVSCDINEIEKHNNAIANIIIIEGSFEFKTKALDNIRYNDNMSKIPILVITKQEEIYHILSYYEKGLTECIKEPFCIEEMVIRIEILMKYRNAELMLHSKLQDLQEYNKNIENQNKKIQMIMDKMPIAMWIKDYDGVYINANIKYYEFADTNPAKVIGKRDEEMWEPELVERILEEDKRVINTKETIACEEIQGGSDGRRVYKVSKSPLLDTQDNIVGLIGTSQDITDYKKREEHILENMRTDFLTNIPNRRKLYDYLDELLEKEDPLIVMSMDIDEFKKINDTHGHKYGDYVLKEFAKKMKKFFEDDFVARLSGDEFIVIKKQEYNKENLASILEEFIKRINETMYIEEQTFNICISVGIVKVSPRTNIETILAKADKAMYNAKKKGKNTFSFYDENTVSEDMKIDSQIEKELYKCIENEEVEIYYQPQYSVDKRLLGFEALFRWKNEKYKTIPINELISIMEKNKLIHKVGRFVFEKACVFAKEINENVDYEIPVCINVSPVQIMRDDFVGEVEEILERTNINPSLITVEITEGVFIKNMKENVEKMNRLRDLGINIFLDDFGTGYSSLNYVVNLPVSAIKIDKTFVDEIYENKRYNSIIKLIIDLAHTIDMDVIAEGVEYDNQLEVLKDMNVDGIQGYVYSKPLRECDAKELIKNNNIRL